MTPTAPTPTKHWHAQSAEQVCADLETDPARGLTPDEATQRLTRHGNYVAGIIGTRPSPLHFNVGSQDQELEQFRLRFRTMTKVGSPRGADLSLTSIRILDGCPSTSSVSGCRQRSSTY